MRVLIITDSFPPRNFGGMAQHASHIANYLAQRHDVLVVALRADRKYVGNANGGYAVRPLLTKRFPALDFRLVAHAAHRFRADVVHVCTAGLVDDRFSARFPVVTRVVGNDFLRPWRGYNLLLRSVLYRLPGEKTRVAVSRWETQIRKAKVNGYLRASHTVAANSSWTRDRLLEAGVAPEHTEVIVGGVDTEVFQPAVDRASVRELLGLRSDCPVLVTAGNLVGKKGFDTILRVLARLTERPLPYYIVVGDGPEEERLQRLASDLGVAGHVSFVGRKNQAELAQYYRAADVYVLASQEETMGRTYFEAGACGIPVLGARVGGVPDVVRHGENGLLVDDPEDEEAPARNSRGMGSGPDSRSC